MDRTSEKDQMSKKDRRIVAESAMRMTRAQLTSIRVGMNR